MYSHLATLPRTGCVYVWRGWVGGIQSQWRDNKSISSEGWKDQASTLEYTEYRMQGNDTAMPWDRKHWRIELRRRWRVSVWDTVGLSHCLWETFKVETSCQMIGVGAQEGEIGWRSTFKSICWYIHLLSFFALCEVWLHIRSHLWTAFYLWNAYPKKQCQGKGGKETSREDVENLARTFQSHHVERKLRLRVQSSEMSHRNMN